MQAQLIEAFVQISPAQLDGLFALLIELDHFRLFYLQAFLMQGDALAGTPGLAASYDDPAAERGFFSVGLQVQLITLRPELRI